MGQTYAEPQPDLLVQGRLELLRVPGQRASQPDPYTVACYACHELRELACRMSCSSPLRWSHPHVLFEGSLERRLGKIANCFSNFAS